MRRPAPDKLAYAYLFPRPKPTDPQNFHEFLERNLVLEVRQEVHSFYGHLDTQEAKYPGLDYTHPGHRTRLSRWPWHRRLFRAFDHLGLTPYEIGNLTKWEGTKWAKERYEKEQNITIRDSAADGMPDYRASRSPPAVQERARNVPAEHRPSSQAHCQPELVYSRNSSITSSRALPSRPAMRTTVTDLLSLARTTSPRPQLPPLPSLQPMLQDSITMAAQRAAVDALPNPIVNSPTDIFMSQENACDDTIDSIGSSERSGSSSSARNADSFDTSTYIQLGENREHIVDPDVVNNLTLMGVEADEWYKTAMESQRVVTIPELRFVHSSFSSGFTTQPQIEESQSQSQPPEQLLSLPPLQGLLDPSSADSDSTLRLTSISSDNEPAHILESARQGDWDNVPQFLHNVLSDANRMTEGG